MGEELCQVELERPVQVGMWFQWRELASISPNRLGRAGECSSSNTRLYHCVVAALLGVSAAVM